MIIIFYPFLIRSFLQDEARNYMEERKVPKELQERVLLWYDYAYQRYCITNISYDTYTICHTIYHIVYGVLYMVYCIWYCMVRYGWYGVDGMIWYSACYGMVWHMVMV